jgi:hypothetical protein
MFRHTFATSHLRSGVDVRTVQKWLGHSDLTTTHKYCVYLDAHSDEAELAVNKMFRRVRSSAGVGSSGAVKTCEGRARISRITGQQLPSIPLPSLASIVGNNWSTRLDVRARLDLLRTSGLFAGERTLTTSATPCNPSVFRLLSSAKESDLHAVLWTVITTDFRKRVSFRLTHFLSSLCAQGV